MDTLWLFRNASSAATFILSDVVFNAAAVAAFLAAHQKVSAVHYPGLASHPNHAVAARQMRAFGGIVAAQIAGGREAAQRLCARVRVFACATSFGGVESLIEHPAIMTHASIPAETRARIGIEDSLVRLSVGLEDVEDITWDLDRALGVSQRLERPGPLGARAGVVHPAERPPFDGVRPIFLNRAPDHLERFLLGWEGVDQVCSLGVIDRVCRRHRYPPSVTV